MTKEPDLEALNIADLRALAQKRLPKGLFEFVDRGTEDEVALLNNRAALDRIKLRPRVLVDVSRRESKTNLFGRELPLPIIIAPTGMADLMWFHGELALARAAARAGIPFTLATSSTTPFEQVAKKTEGMSLFFADLDRNAIEVRELVSMTIVRTSPIGRVVYSATEATGPFDAIARSGTIR